ncbi:hypothetical protein OE88DRAFT_1165686 [Heliocybe sulcata]|uniref:Uncharacterized protein n=1 Tax=Heliocybe sulcata TaxID=5364 RepID=A0A5C3NDW3_9AGAM|nr:hypothetical protein OE88DRAFT_1165686 [Heliocybe sulcata]
MSAELSQRWNSPRETAYFPGRIPVVFLSLCSREWRTYTMTAGGGMSMKQRGNVREARHDISINPSWQTRANRIGAKYQAKTQATLPTSLSQAIILPCDLPLDVEVLSRMLA